VKPNDKPRYPTGAEEENLLLEVLEDSRLRGLGIDPDGDTVDIMFEIFRRADALESDPKKKILAPKNPRGRSKRQRPQGKAHL
jgi:hypothetical protein